MTPKAKLNDILGQLNLMIEKLDHAQQRQFQPCLTLIKNMMTDRLKSEEITKKQLQQSKLKIEEQLGTIAKVTRELREKTNESTTLQGKLIEQQRINNKLKDDHGLQIKRIHLELDAQLQQIKQEHEAQTGNPAQPEQQHNPERLKNKIISLQETIVGMRERIAEMALDHKRADTVREGLEDKIFNSEQLASSLRTRINNMKLNHQGELDKIRVRHNDQLKKATGLQLDNAFKMAATSRELIASQKVAKTLRTELAERNNTIEKLKAEIKKLRDENTALKTPPTNPALPSEEELKGMVNSLFKSPAQPGTPSSTSSPSAVKGMSPQRGY